jgi:uncharacterized protein
LRCTRRRTPGNSRLHGVITSAKTSSRGRYIFLEAGITGPRAAGRKAGEAAAFRRLVDHLRARSDVQTIDLMELAGFCRNCLSRWYREAAEELELELSEAAARERVYGMPYEEWKKRHQGPRRT